MEKLCVTFSINFTHAVSIRFRASLILSFKALRFEQTFNISYELSRSLPNQPEQRPFLAKLGSGLSKNVFEPDGYSLK